MKKEHILYKAKNSETKEWVKGSLVAFKKANIYNENGFFEIDEETICLFSGFKLGEEQIFEDDILEFVSEKNKEKYVVKFQQGCFVLINLETEISEGLLSVILFNCALSFLKIVGNIHENS